ncbi:unnamed protein product, partial [marine sediment metagenome]
MNDTISPQISPLNFAHSLAANESAASIIGNDHLKSERSYFRSKACSSFIGCNPLVATANLLLAINQHLKALTACDSIEQLQTDLAHEMQAFVSRAIYFSSCRQEPATVDIVQRSLQPSFNLPSTNIATVPTPHAHKAYFITAILTQLAQLKTTMQSRPRIAKPHKFAIYTTAIIAILAFSGFCGVKLTRSINNINHTAQTAYALSLLKQKAPNQAAAFTATKLLVQQFNTAANFWPHKTIKLNLAQLKSETLPTTSIQTQPVIATPMATNN